jgi:hypothetical protein
MNLYLVGHGYRMSPRDTMPVGGLTVPANFTLKFYCKENKLFDSSWEEFIVLSGGTLKKCPNLRGVNDWEVTEIPAKKSFKEHCLTRPGNMRTYIDMTAMKEIKVPQKHRAIVNVTLGDGDTLCVKQGAKLLCKNVPDEVPWISLSALIAALAKKAPGGATVHWCACRSVLGQDTINDALTQARSPWLGVLPKTN